MDPFDSAMDIVLVVIYGVTSVVFIPLFIIIAFKLSRDYQDLFEEIKCKIVVLFILFNAFLIFRMILYTDLKYTHFIEEDITGSTEVPFYISEILISLTIAYILYSVSRISGKT